MDSKIVFVRTSKGEDEVHSRSMHLPGDIKRALLMVDGKATFGEIFKHAAPSLRPGLEATLQELEKDGYIVDKAKSGNIPKMTVLHGVSVPPRMSVPTRMVTPHKAQSEDEGAGDLDFISGPGASSSKTAEAETNKAAAVSKKLKSEGEERASQEIEIEAARFHAQQETEALLHRAEQEAARIREEAEREKRQAAAEIHAREEVARRAREEAEAAGLRAEQEAKARHEAEARILQQAEAARRAGEEAEAAKLRAEQEAKARHEAEARMLQQAEAARRAKEEAEAARLRNEQAVKVRLEAEAKALLQAEAARRKAEQEAAIAYETAERLARQEREAARAREEAEKRAMKEAEAKATITPPAAKPDTFAFGAFHVDEPQPMAKPHQVEQPAQKASPAETEHAPKRDTFSFDSFKIEIPELPVEQPTKEKAGPAQQPDDAAKAAAHPVTRQPAQQEAPPLVAGKPVGGTPSEEEIQRATQERIETEKRMEEEALAAKKHADAQAKAHAEAEQRKAEIARAEIEQATKKAKFSVDAAPASHVAKPAPVARVRRKPFSLGRLVGFMFKLGVFLLVLLTGALFVAPYIVPTRDYIPPIEKLLSAKLHQPVHIGYLSGRILPTPRMELSEIYIGHAKQFQTEQAQINFAMAGLIIEATPIDSIELQGVKVSGAGLQKVTAWMQQLAADTEYPVARIVISRGTLDADVVKLSGVEGALEFNQIGEFVNANLRSNEGKYNLDINAAPGNKARVTITLRDSALPLLPNWQFEELTAKGTLSNNDLSIGEFDGRILGGILQGNASVDWRSGWRAQGTMVAKSIPMQRLNRLLEGNVEGTARFKMSAVDLAGLADSATLDGSFTSKSGMISGMDIVATARTRSREHLPGGRTHFDELSGIVTFSNNTLHFKQIKVTTDVLNAGASLDFDKQQISGSITARLSLQEATKPADLQIGGAIDSPTLRFVQ